MELEATGDASHDRAGRDVWGRTLTQVPTTFGKIAYLSSLRSEHSGRYRHYGLAQLYGEETSDQVLRESHEQVFATWLSYSLEEQRSDLEQYFGELEEDRRTVLSTWLALRPYRALAPAAAGAAEQYLFNSDLELILDLLQSERNAEEGDAPG